MKAARLMDSLANPPDARDWLKAAEAQAPGGNLGLMLNGSLGDCTIAAKGHIRQIWTANNGTMQTAPDSVILADYERVDGYVDGNPATDNGGVMADVNAAWMAPGGVAGAEIDRVIPIRYQLLDDIMKSVDRYGFADCGLALPLTAQNQTVWTVAIGSGNAAAMGSWGGHDAAIVAYDKGAGLFVFETWGERQPASFDWVLAYVDEAYTGISKALWAPNGSVPNGMLAADLDADLAVLS